MKLRLCISEHQLKPAARCFAWWVFAAGGMLFGRQGLSWDRKIIPKGFLLFSTILRMICCDGLKPRISLFVHISTLFQKYVILYFALNGWWLQWWFRWPDAGRAVGFLFWGMQKSFHWDHCNKSRKKKGLHGHTCFWKSFVIHMSGSCRVFPERKDVIRSTSPRGFVGE